MAKSKSFFGLRSGSTKSLTFQVYRGEQITKDRVYRVSNPRTEAQMTQRALIPIVAAARSALKGLIDHSFEGVAYGEASLKEFSKQNLRAGALSVTSYSPNGVSNPGFANLIVSNGSINVPFDMGTQEDGTVIKVTGGESPIIEFPAAEANADAKPIFSAIAEWARNNNKELLKPGTQLTFLSIYEAGSVKVGAAIGGQDVSTSAFAISRIYIPNGDEDSENAKNINGKWKVAEKIQLGASEVTLVNDFGDKITFEGGDKEEGSTAIMKIHVQPKEASNGSACGMALILSRFENGMWKRNTARLEIDFEPNYVYTFKNWLSTYQTTGAASKKYLNTGDEGTGIQG